ncbi:MAG: hypothetical protein IT536_01655 [Hyphomicrobiales bacterium]|nr:hypothetical protein [Hyphomicrobiales bacterium]
MWLMLAYLLFALIGNVIIYFLGLGVEMAWPAASLPAFLLMFFAMLWIAWVVAVKVTAPREADSGSAG